MRFHQSIALLFLGLFIAVGPAQAAGQSTLEIATKSGVHPFSVELATTEAEREKGLMFRKELPEGQGMLFDFHREQEVYFGSLPTGKIEMGRIGIGEMPAAASSAATSPIAVGPAINASPPKTASSPNGSSVTSALAGPFGPLSAVGSSKKIDPDEAARTITVKILVDEEEATRRPIWERRLKERVAAASDILERHCGMKLKVVATDTWQSDNSISDFEGEVAEFIKKVDPGEARLAIGFTSQFQIPKGRTHLGGTRGPLAHHILLREWSQIVSEPERLELLVHEIGHFLGAVHSPEPDSVMRSILGDRQARAKRFLIHYDPLNTLAMNFVAEEWRQRGTLNSVFDLSQPTRERMHAVYETINQSLPTDPAAVQYLRILNRLSGQPDKIDSP